MEPGWRGWEPAERTLHEARNSNNNNNNNNSSNLNPLSLWIPARLRERGVRRLGAGAALGQTQARQPRAVHAAADASSPPLRRCFPEEPGLPCSCQPSCYRTSVKRQRRCPCAGRGWFTNISGEYNYTAAPPPSSAALLPGPSSPLRLQEERRRRRRRGWRRGEGEGKRSGWTPEIALSCSPHCNVPLSGALRAIINSTFSGVKLEAHTERTCYVPGQCVWVCLCVCACVCVMAVIQTNRSPATSSTLADTNMSATQHSLGFELTTASPRCSENNQPAAYTHGNIPSHRLTSAE